MNINNLLSRASSRIKRLFIRAKKSHPIQESLSNLSKVQIASGPNVLPIKQTKKVRILYFLIVILLAAIGIILFYFIGYDTLLAKIKNIRLPQFIYGTVTYTKNPASSKLPSSSVVKIIINKDSEDKTESSGSGLLFTDDGLILTNAHVVASPLGKGSEDITICYVGEDGRTPKCEYEGKVIDLDMENDLAVIKSKKPIREVSPYKIVITEDEESLLNETVPYSTGITAVGFPGVGGSSITITKGTVSGYQDNEMLKDDCSLMMFPEYLKTDTEINFGNSGGAVFDNKNRYIGISSLFIRDDGGKISYITFWNRINWYLGDLVKKRAITLSNDQYVITKKSENAKILNDAKTAMLKEDYSLAKQKYEEYTKKEPTDSRGWCGLCSNYVKSEEMGSDEFKRCAEELRSLNNGGIEMSQIFTSSYLLEKKELDKALESVDKALASKPDSVIINIFKAILLNALGKNTDMHKVAQKIIKIDPTNADAWFYEGRYQMFEEDNIEGGISMLEYSYYLKPQASTAAYLGEIYETINKVKPGVSDTLSAMKYRIAALILEPEDISNLHPVVIDSLMLFVLLEDSTGEKLKLMKQVLDELELTKEMVESIGNMPADNIKKYLEKSNIESLKSTDEVAIKSTSELLRMFSSWLFVFMGEKGSCVKDYYLPYDELIKYFDKLGYKKDGRATLLHWNTIMLCLCENSDTSKDVVDACYIQKSKNLCGENSVFDQDTGCIPLSQYCKNIFGPNVSAVNGKCICNAGYTNSETTGKCTSMCSYREYYSNGSCYCNTSYPVLRNGKCISHSEDCEQAFGVHSFGYTSDGTGGTNCYCDTGYKWLYAVGTSPNYCVSIY